MYFWNRQLRGIEMLHRQGKEREGKAKLAVLRGMKETGKGFVWARSLERFVWLGEAELPLSETEAPAGGDDLAPPEGGANGAIVQKRIF